MADSTRETMTIKATGNSSAAPSTNNGEEAAKPSRQKKEDGGRIVKDKELICQQDMVDLMAELPDDATRSRVGLAQQFKVTQPTISDIVRVRRRKHLTTKPPG